MAWAGCGAGTADSSTAAIGAHSAASVGASPKASIGANPPAPARSVARESTAGARRPGPASRGAAYAVDLGHRIATAELAGLGREIFFDPSLSASGRIACAGCHDPRHAFAPANGLAVQLAGANGDTPGLRAVPSLRYLQTVPPFSEHFFDNEGDDSADAGPTGGRTWDGRAGSAHEQAALPLLSPLEMAGGTPERIVARLGAAPYAARFRTLWGAGIFDHADRAFAAAAMALEVYQEGAAEFQPFSSRYDAVLRGQASLTAAQARGRAVFEDPARGNCASCHPSEPGPDGAAPLFSDFGFVAIGVPRNRRLAANADPSFFDLGLCGPLREDLRDRPELCGRFRTPSLRNVATRRSFFHNGVVRSLDEAVRFYASRDSDPARWYGRDRAGQPREFDDLPPRYRSNVERGAPFGGRPGGPPALDEGEVSDIVAFLGTLTDADALPAAGDERSPLVGPPTTRSPKERPQTPISSISR
ncbi:MAG TPA: cytochrome c peroxidase [Caldimonas sp.]|nr:cytochrome c peroxidase [Caldimonas sp.]